MRFDLLILADSTDELVKFVFGALFVLIWIAGAITSSAKKKQKERRRMMERQGRAEQRPETRLSWQEIYQDLTKTQDPGPAMPGRVTVRREEPPPLPGQAQHAQQPPLPQRGAGGQGRKDKRGPRRKANKPAPPPVPVDEEPVRQLVPSGPTPADRTPPLESPGASAPRRAVTVNARSLRQQFILTEILRPPVTMREDEGR